MVGALAAASATTPSSARNSSITAARFDMNRFLARDATTTFAQRGIGDVLLAWENEAYLAEKSPGSPKSCPPTHSRAAPPWGSLPRRALTSGPGPVQSLV